MSRSSASVNRETRNSTCANSAVPGLVVPADAQSTVIDSRLAPGVEQADHDECRRAGIDDDRALREEAKPSGGLHVAAALQPVGEHEVDRKRHHGERHEEVPDEICEDDAAPVEE